MRLAGAAMAAGRHAPSARSAAVAALQHSDKAETPLAPIEAAADSKAPAKFNRLNRVAVCGRFPSSDPAAPSASGRSPCFFVRIFLASHLSDLCLPAVALRRMSRSRAR